MSAAERFLILFGAGGHARSVADVASRLAWVRGIAFLDAPGHASGQREMLGFPVFSTLESALEESRIHAMPCLHLAIGNGNIRRKLAEEMADSQPQLAFATIVAASAGVGLQATLGTGCFVGEGVHIGPRARIGTHSIVNTHAVVEHDATVGAFSHVSVHATLAGGAKLGAHAMLGAGAVVRDGIAVGDGAVIGAGAVVVKAITDAGPYAGVPARPLPSAKA